jgi:TRAP-type mannitol/chloroaromatic compound transport system substrate-binding protein
MTPFGGSHGNPHRTPKVHRDTGRRNGVAAHGVRAATCEAPHISQPSCFRTMTTVRCLRFAGALVVALAVLMAAPAFAQIKWTLPSAYPADNFHSQNLEAFAKDLADVTGGKLSIKVYPNASLLPISAIKSAVRMGHMQIGETLISLHDNEDPVFGIDVVPFLATSYDEARKLWAASKPLIERKLAEQGLMPLFAVPWPPQGIFASKEINEICDMKGLSWRVYNAGTQRIAQLVSAYPRLSGCSLLLSSTPASIARPWRRYCGDAPASSSSA